MKHTIYFLTILALVAISPPGRCLYASSGNSNAKESHEGHKHDTESFTKYQCSMHPNIVSDDPGSCPICGMELQPVADFRPSRLPGRNNVALNERQQQLINLRTSPVVRQRVTIEKEVPGVIVHDDSKVFSISAWVDGRIEKLYVDEEEVDIQPGQLLYALYSPRLYAALQEYLDLRHGEFANDDLLHSAYARLLQMGLGEDMIDELAARTQAPLIIDIPSPIHGKVMKKMVRLGQYVKEGDLLYTVVDLSDLWIIAELYESDLPFISRGQKVTATTPAVPGEVFKATVELLNHHIDAETRTARVRIVFDDPGRIMQRDAAGGHRGHKLLPDMWMRVQLKKDLGEKLSIPRNALFDTGRHQYVFIEEQPGTYVPREVNAGLRVADKVIIESGASEGERVVTDGTFLLDSESLLKASALGSELSEPANLEELEPMPGAGNHGELNKLWESYLAVKNALASDDLDEAALASVELKNEVFRLSVSKEGQPSWVNKALADASKLDFEGGIRSMRIDFGHLSNALIDWIGENRHLAPGSIHIANCPMWHDSPNRWLQTTQVIENPFMGKTMPSCGSIEETIHPGLSND